MPSSVHYPTASLKPHREESLLNGHLWIFSGALQQPPHWIEPGGLVDVKSATGQFVARGYYNPHTDIAIRILTHDAGEAIDETFLRRRIRDTVALRQIFDPDQTNMYRLIHAEGDALPGLVVDRFADILVAQIHTAGMERLRPLLLDALMEETGVQGLLLRNDGQSRRREGLEIEEPAIAAGEVPAQVAVRENRVQFLVDPWQGQKTGFFIDQRDKREALRKYARDKRVLNCFSYTGGFSVYAALTSNKTSVTSVDISAPAIDAARQHFILNGLEVLRPGGILLSCSCSGVVGMDDLLGVLSQVAQRLHRSVQLLETYTHGVDHPINLAMPETSYLKAVFCRVGLGA